MAHWKFGNIYEGFLQDKFISNKMILNISKSGRPICCRNGRVRCTSTRKIPSNNKGTDEANENHLKTSEFIKNITITREINFCLIESIEVYLYRV